LKVESYIGARGSDGMMSRKRVKSYTYTETFRFEFPNGEVIDLPTPEGDEWEEYEVVRYNTVNRFVGDANLMLGPRIKHLGGMVVWKEYVKRLHTERARVLLATTYRKRRVGEKVIPERGDTPALPLLKGISAEVKKRPRRLLQDYVPNVMVQSDPRPGIKEATERAINKELNTIMSGGIKASTFCYICGEAEHKPWHQKVIDAEALEKKKEKGKRPLGARAGKNCSICGSPRCGHMGSDGATLDPSSGTWKKPEFSAMRVDRDDLREAEEAFHREHPGYCGDLSRVNVLVPGRTNTVPEGEVHFRSKLAPSNAAPLFTWRKLIKEIADNKKEKEEKEFVPFVRGDFKAALKSFKTVVPEYKGDVVFIVSRKQYDECIYFSSLPHRKWSVRMVGVDTSIVIKSDKAYGLGDPVLYVWENRTGRENFSYIKGYR